MKSAWHRTLVLILSTAYLSVVTLGHCFHNHQRGRHVAGGGADACLSCGHEQGHDADAPECHHPAGKSDPLPSPAVDRGQADNHCGVCSFFSHFYLPSGVPGDFTIGHAFDQIVAATPSVAAGEPIGPQQPRAPPRFV